MNEFAQILIIELVILVALAWMGRPRQFIAVLVAGFLSLAAFLTLGKEKQIFGEDALLLLVPVVFVSCGARILWMLVRNPAQALQAMDTYLMEESVAKQLARGEGSGGRPSYGNWRVAQEIVRNLKGRDKE
jgi:hypothetical protein